MLKAFFIIVCSVLSRLSLSVNSSVKQREEGWIVVFLLPAIKSNYMHYNVGKNTYSLVNQSISNAEHKDKMGIEV